METPDTRITGTPIYHAGLIDFALGTGINNGTQVVPGIFWAQVAPVIDAMYGKPIGGSVYQQGYFNFGGDNATSFGTLMPGNDNNLLMVYELMGHILSTQRWPM